VIHKPVPTLKVGIMGLNHDHIHLILSEYRKGNVNIVGIAEPDKKLWEKFGKAYNLPDSLFFDDLRKMCTTRKPAIVLGYNAVGKHVDIVETCAPLGISVMVEKPLAATLEQARVLHAGNGLGQAELGHRHGLQAGSVTVERSMPASQMKGQARWSLACVF